MLSGKFIFQKSYVTSHSGLECTFTFMFFVVLRSIHYRLSQNWFIKHQSSYGTIHYTSRIAIVYVIIVVALFCICRYFHVTDTDNSIAFIFATIFNLLSLILPLAFGTILWCMLPPFIYI